MACPIVKRIAPQSSEKTTFKTFFGGVFFAYGGCPPNSFFNAAKGPRFCPIDAYLHAHMLGLGVSNTLKYQRLGILN